MKNSTPLGQEILRRLAGGETVQAIAESWGVSRQAAYAHLEKARVAIGARTRYEAVALCSRNGHGGR